MDPLEWGRTAHLMARHSFPIMLFLVSLTVSFQIMAPLPLHHLRQMAPSYLSNASDCKTKGKGSEGNSRTKPYTKPLLSVRKPAHMTQIFLTKNVHLIIRRVWVRFLVPYALTCQLQWQLNSWVSGSSCIWNGADSAVLHMCYVAPELHA